MSEDAEPGPIRLALVIEDPALADRLAALLAGVPGLRLVGGTEAADAVVVPSTAVSPSAAGDSRSRLGGVEQGDRHRHRCRMGAGHLDHESAFDLVLGLRALDEGQTSVHGSLGNPVEWQPSGRN